MAGTLAGGRQAAATNKSKYGDDFYKNLGKLGGSAHRPETRYFYINREAARQAGTKGGQKSRRPKKEQ